MTDFRMSGLIFGSDSEEEMFDKTDYIEQLNNVHKNNGFLDLSMTDLPRYDIFNGSTDKNVGKRRIRHVTTTRTTLEIKKSAISVCLAHRQKVNQFSMHLTQLRIVREHQKMKMQQFQLHNERKNELHVKKFFPNQNKIQIK